jgi:NADPH-dependent 2,4-dienoyl-CoA reductase/sulfur reductase-like enzyme
VVVVGIGAVPVTEWLEGSGLEIDNGILCDATGQTGLPGIVAAGDCARWQNPLYPERPRFEHWTSAVEESGVAAARLLGGSAAAIEPFAQVPYMWTDQFENRIAMVGQLAEGDEMHVCQGSLEERRCLVLFGRGGRLVAAVGFRRPVPLLACRREIAARLSWEDALAKFGAS